MKCRISHLILLSFLVLPLLLRAVQTDNHGIHAVPASAVKIDGDLDDWDLSGKVLFCYDIETLRDVYSAEVAMMYDADNLYVGILWKDAIPMGNSHDPRYQAGKAWAGDAVQLRIKTDRISHITAWYYGEKNEPGLLIDYGKSLTEPFKGGSRQLFRSEGWKLSDGAEMAFKKDADGRGYVQEMKIPWALITVEKRYAAGDRFSCGIELLWGEGDWPLHRYADNLADGASSREFFWTAHNNWGTVILEPAGHLNLPPAAYLKASEVEKAQGPVPINYSIPKDARVTVAINDTNGRRIRNLLPALPRKQGKNTEYWDGLDDNGKPVEPGAYQFSGLYHDGIHVNYVMSFCNPGDPTWETDDGRGAFYGDHTNPQAVAAAGEYVALACPMGESGKHLIGCDLNGRRLWGLHNRVAFDGGRISLATDGKILWVANEGKQSTIYRVDIATGKYAPWDRTAIDASGQSFPVLDLKISGEIGMGSDPEVAAKVGNHNASSSNKGPNLRSIAYRDGILAVCLSREDKIALLNAATGDQLAERKITAPRSVVIDRDGSLIVLAEDRLKRIDPNGKETNFGSVEILNGHSLALDSTGNLYVSVRGEEQNVKVFSSSGKPLREIGRRGGRPNHGPFVDQAMRNPAQIAIDSKQRLWVAEETGNPKRTSIWNSADGKLLFDLTGTTGYAGAGGLNPDDPAMAFAENTVWKIDLETGAWRPVFSIGRSDDPSQIFPPRVFGIKNRVITRNGCTYVFTTGTTGGAGGGGEVSCTMFDGRTWRPAAHLGTADKKRFPAHEGKLFAWADANGDGLAQESEISFEKLTFEGKPASLASNYWGQLPGPDGAIVYMVRGAQALVQFPIKGFTPAGAPIYDAGSPDFVKLADKSLHPGEGSIMGGSEGRTYLNQNPLLAVDRSGKILGSYPNPFVSVHGSHNAASARPGYLIGPSSILGTANMGGEAGEIFDLNGNLGENYLFTQDALYIQTLLKDTRGAFDTPAKAVRGMSMDATTAGGESFGGNFIRAKNGKVYLTIGATDARVLEVTGLDSIRRFSGHFQYTPEQYAQSQALLRGKAAERQAPKTYKVARVESAPVIDGKSGDWMLPNNSSVEIQESPQKKHGSVQACYDASNLYLLYRVNSPSGRMRNAGQDYRLLFKTGDIVDLMLGPDPLKPEDAGNLRLILTLMEGKPVAVLNQKKAAGAAPADRFEFASPWRSIAFDRVVPAPEVSLAIAPAQGGYAVEAAIPWRILGLEPRPGLKLKADLGILFADKGGTTTVSRQYWSNKATGLVNDIPGEADLTPELWGEIILE